MFSRTALHIGLTEMRLLQALQIRQLLLVMVLKKEAPSKSEALRTGALVVAQMRVQKSRLANLNILNNSHRQVY
jgi:hypothetical protein